MEREDPNERRLRDIKKLIVIGVPMEEINRLYPSTTGFGGRTKVTTPRTIVQYEAEHGEIDISNFGRQYGRIITAKDGTIRLSASEPTLNNSAAAAVSSVSKYGRKLTTTQRNNYNYATTQNGAGRRHRKKRNTRRRYRR
jgi:hypothetical protein